MQILTCLSFLPLVKFQFPRICKHLPGYIVSSLWSYACSMCSDDVCATSMLLFTGLYKWVWSSGRCNCFWSAFSKCGASVTQLLRRRRGCILLERILCFGLLAYKLETRGFMSGDCQTIGQSQWWTLNRSDIPTNRFHVMTWFRLEIPVVSARWAALSSSKKCFRTWCLFLMDICRPVHLKWTGKTRGAGGIFNHMVWCHTKIVCGERESLVVDWLGGDP